MMKHAKKLPCTSFSSDDSERVWRGESQLPQPGGDLIPYQSEAGFVNLFEGEEALAEVFFVAYSLAPALL